MRVIPPTGLWRRAYHVDFRTEAARDFLADQSDYTDSAGAVWSVENHAAAGATFGIGASGLTIVGTAGTNVTGSTRTAPLLRTPVSGLGFASERYIIHTAMDIVVTTPTTNTGALVLFEAASGNNNSRNYIGDTSGTARASAMATIGGTSTTVNSYDPPGGHPAVIRLESFTGLGGDWDFYGDGGALGAVDPRATLRDMLAFTKITARPFGWDRGANFDADGTGRLAFSVANQATLVVRWVRVNYIDLGQ